MKLDTDNFCVLPVSNSAALHFIVQIGKIIENAYQSVYLNSYANNHQEVNIENQSYWANSFEIGKPSVQLCIGLTSIN